MFCDKLTEKAIVLSDNPLAKTKNGNIAGIKKSSTYIFRGIKYANAERFHMPSKVGPWENSKPAVSYGYVCPERTTPIGYDAQVCPHYYMPQDENCQYLNIWTQSLDRNEKKPVMVWMHGGGWNSGSSVEQYAYDGEELSKFGNVVVVSFNHRHNVLGSLDLSEYGEEYAKSSYCAMGDIIECLKWIKENISCFGGNPENVMLFGQSGGVAKILYTMQCPECDGLYHKVAIDSGGIKEQIIPEGYTKKQIAQKLARLTVEKLGLSKQTIKKIEEFPYWDLVEAANQAEEKLKEELGRDFSWRWEPIEDGELIIGSTLKNGFRKETSKIPMIIGNVFGEANSNLIPNNKLGDGYKNHWSDLQIQTFCKEKWGNEYETILEEFKKVYPDNNPADVLFMDYKERDGQLNLVKKRLEIGGDVWNWLFKKESDLNGGTVAWHCSEIPFVFHNVSFIEASFEPGISDQLEDIMCQAWVNMAYSGNPNGGCVPGWNKMQKDNIYTMIFDEKCKVEKNHDIKLRELLKKADK